MSTVGKLVHFLSVAVADRQQRLVKIEASAGNGNTVPSFSPSPSSRMAFGFRRSSSWRSSTCRHQYPLAYGNKVLVDEFSIVVKSMLKQMDVLENENPQLAQLRDWLLPLLMNGQVTVAERRPA